MTPPEMLENEFVNISESDESGKSFEIVDSSFLESISNESYED